MKAAHTILLLLAPASVLLTGCGVPAEKTPQLEGVKLRDLRPVDASRRGMALPPSVNLKVVVFSIPADNYERAMRLASAAMDSGPGILSSPADFRANGLAAATSGIGKMEAISEILRQARATVVTSNYYSVFDDRGDDVEMTGLPQPQSITYTNKSRVENITLRPGRLAIRMIVTRFAGRASVFRMKVLPVWKPQQDATFIERVSGSSRDIVFGAAGINTNMQAGEMILIAPSPVSHSDITIADTIFTAPDGEWMKMVLIMCTGINQ